MVEAFLAEQVDYAAGNAGLGVRWITVGVDSNWAGRAKTGGVGIVCGLEMGWAASKDRGGITATGSWVRVLLSLQSPY